MLYLIAVCGLEEGLQAWIGKHTNATLQNTIYILAAKKKQPISYLVVNQHLTNIHAKLGAKDPQPRE
jgi:hypothetical protein